MNLIELNEQNKNTYNTFISSQDNGSFLQSWEWGMWQEKLGRKAFRFFVTDDTGNTIASMQVLRMPLPMGRCYLYVPYGPVLASGGQFSIFSPEADHASRDNFQWLTQELQKRFPNAVFLRIEPKSDLLPTNHYPLITKSANIQPAKTLVLDLLKSEEQLLSEMHHKTRYNIKLAQRHGLEITSDLAVVPGHGLYTKEALDLITQTAGRQGFKTFTRNYYQQLLDFFAIQNSNSDLKIYVYKALLNKELLTAAIMVDFGGTRTYLFGGSSSEHREVMAPYLLHFTAIKNAQTLGLRQYDFWGIETSSGDTPGFVRFKMGFGGTQVEYSGAYDIVFNKFEYFGYKMLRRLNRLMR